MASAAKSAFNFCCIFSLFRVLCCSSILSINFIFSSNAAHFALMIMKLSLDEREKPEFFDLIECGDVCYDLDLMLALTDNVSSLSSTNTLKCSSLFCLNRVFYWRKQFDDKFTSKSVFSKSSQLFNSSSVFSVRAIMYLSFLSTWSRSLAAAKNGWNVVTLAWKHLCAAFVDFALRAQWNWKPFSVVVVECVSDVSPFSGVARGVFLWWLVKCVLCGRYYFFTFHQLNFK